MSIQSQIDRINSEVNTQTDLISQITAALDSKAGKKEETWIFTLDDDTTVEKVVYVE